MDYVLTFLEGIVTFVSPCLLPMLPIYLAYFAGGADEAPGGEGAEGARVGQISNGSTLARTLANALAFVAGFSLFFVVLGAFAGTVGGMLVRSQRQLNLVCGTLVALLGLNYLGVVRLGFLDRGRGLQKLAVPKTFATSFAFGLVFAVGWTPCVGTFLASALSLAAASASAGRGVALLLCFSAGLGIPFVLSALLIDQLEGTFAWIKAHYGSINRACGALLVLVGIMMATGTLGRLLGLLAFA